MGVFELLRLSDPLREMVTARADAAGLRRKASELGELLPLRDAAWALVRDGLTTPAEAMRVVGL
jgi:type II secretory ATPase GspE/PulE/Tfp pilus assembly ATPase PilB-like protein